MIITLKVALRLVALILVFVLLQSTFFSMVEFLGSTIWILPAAVTIFGLLGGSMVGAGIGFTIGLLSDGLADGPLGTSCLVFMGIGYLAGLYRERGFVPNVAVAAALAAIATFAANAALGLLTLLLDFDGYLSAAAIPELILQAAYAFLLAVPMFILVRRVLRPALVDERASKRRDIAALES
jgi:cell shape-determining protein MreD